MGLFELQKCAFIGFYDLWISHAGALAEQFFEQLRADFRVLKIIAEGVHDRLFDLLNVVRGPIRASSSTRLACPRAVNADASCTVGFLHDHRAAAFSAAQQSGEEMLLPKQRPIGAVLDRAALLAGLNALPQILRNDPQVGHLFALPLCLWVDPRNSPSSVWVTDHPHPVPDQLAMIKGVLQDAVAALLVAVDRGGLPLGTPWGQDALGVQIACDFSGRGARGIGFKDAQNDRSFCFVYVENARLALSRRVAEGSPSGAPAVVYDALHPAADLVPCILHVHLRDYPAQADGHRVRAALVHRLDIYAGECQALVDRGHFCLIAGEPVEGFHNQDFKLPALRGLHHVQQAVASDHRLPGSRHVSEIGHYFNAKSAGVLVANRLLIRDRLVGLMFG